MIIKQGKPAVKSLGVVGGAIAMLPAIDYIGMGFGWWPAPVVAPAAAIIISAAGGLLAILGRVNATQEITTLLRR